MISKYYPILLLPLMLTLSGKRSLAQGCQVDSPKIEGKVTKIERAPIAGAIYGFSEYTFRGAWASNMNYQLGDSVLYQNRFWKHAGATIGSAPSYSTADWRPAEAVKYASEIKSIHYFLEGETEESEPSGRDNSHDDIFIYTRTYNTSGNVTRTCAGSGIYRFYQWWQDGPTGNKSTAYFESSGGRTINADCSNSGYTAYAERQWGLGQWVTDSDSTPYTQTDSVGRAWDGYHILDTDVTTITSTQSNHVMTGHKEFVEMTETLTWTNLGTLAARQGGSSVATSTARQILEQAWIPSHTAYAYLGSWSAPDSNTFSFTGQAIRYRVAFGCLPENPQLEFIYRIWPIGADELTDGYEEPETKTIKKADIEVQEDGTKEIKGFIEPLDGYNKRLIRVTLLTPCGSNGGEMGSSNEGSVDSAHWWVSMGKGQKGAPIGNLRINEKSLSPASFTPKRLRYDGGLNSEVEVIQNQSGDLRQVKAPTGLADVVAAQDGFSYEIRFYDDADVDDKDPETGLYELNGLPASVWKVENPDGGAGSNKLKISHVEGGEEEYLFTQGPAGLWSLNRNEARIEEVTESTLGNGNRQVIRTVKDGNGVASYQIREEYKTYPWGERMVAQSEDPNGANLTTTWSYYDITPGDGAAYGRLKQVIHPSGGWQRYQYDSQGRQSKLISCYLDGAVGANEADSRVISTTWSTDGLTATTIETVLGNEVGRKYWIKAADGSQIVEQVCTVAGAAIDDSTNLVTTTTYVTSGEFKGEIASMKRPEGTMTIYSRAHANGLITTTVKNGQPDASSTDIVAGQQSVTVEDEMGNPVSSETKDIASALTLESVTYTDLDEFGRPLRIDYNDGSYETTTYACCGVETARNRDGEITVFDYDDLGRVSTETRDGLTTIFTYDGSGRIRTRTRKGTDNSEILLESNTYDLAGRMETRTDALNHVTEFEEEILGNGRTQRSTTYPDTGTSIEIRHKDGRQYSLSGTAVNPAKYEYGAQNGLEFTKQILIGDAGEETEWSTTYTDLAGRTKQIAQANGGNSYFYYNGVGQLSKQTDPDGVTTLFTYNAQGEREKTVIDINRDDQIGNTDTISISASSVLNAHNTTVTRQETRMVNLANTEEIASRVDTTPNGKKSWSENWGLLTTSDSVVGSNGSQTATLTNPDGSTLVRNSVYGRPTSEVFTANGGAIVRSVTFGYDPHRRLQSETDARNGATTYTYTALDQVETITTPVPGPGYTAQTTTYGYDAMGRKILETLPDSSQVSTPHNTRGELTGTGGSQTYTVGCTYTSQGRMKTMTTTGQAGPEVTTWEYYPDSGLLRYKIYPDATRTEYTYTAAGRLQTRKWARGIITTYGYDNAGLQTSVDYSDSTSDVSTPRNRLGQISSRTDAAGVCELTHSTDGRLLTETYTSGMFDGVVLTHGHDTLLRRNSHTAVVGSSTLQTGYDYDGASRLWKVTSGSDQAVYYYVPNSSLLDHIEHKHGGATVMTTGKVFDKINRLESITATTAGGNVVSSSSYLYDSLNRRHTATAEDGTHWSYGYNNNGELTSGSRKWSDNTNVAGQQFGYTFDPIGNRVDTTTNGRTATYTPNILNQYTEREVPGAVDILGSTSALTVRVNGQSTERKGSYFSKVIAVDNSATAQHEEITVSALKQNAGPNREDVFKEDSGHYYLPRTPEDFDHDLDGNLTKDGRWIYTWDGENRLVNISSLPNSADGKSTYIEFKYDGHGRRVNKSSVISAAPGQFIGSDYKWLYDEWNPTLEIGALGNVAHFIWGADLSGQLLGAGGIGGLLAIRSGFESFYPSYDGNGNVTASIKANNQSIVSQYIYGPFGEPLQTFESEIAFPFRFSTKVFDRETGLSYYGYRFYDPARGRWLNRDPIGEEGGENLYGACANDLLNEVDALGEKVLGLELRGDGTGWLDSLPGESWFLSFGHQPQFQSTVKGPELGYHGGWDGKDPIGMFKWEAKAWWCIPADRTLPTWKATLEKFRFSVTDAHGKIAHVPWSGRNKPDGPSQVIASVMDKHGHKTLATGTWTETYAWDAPRFLVDPQYIEKGGTYKFFGIWNLDVSDTENKWSTKFQIEFSFPDNPKLGSGKFTVLSPPKEVP